MSLLTSSTPCTEMTVSPALVVCDVRVRQPLHVRVHVVVIVLLGILIVVIRVQVLHHRLQGAQDCVKKQKNGESLLVFPTKQS